jgi:hypothetical protein
MQGQQHQTSPQHEQQMDNMPLLRCTKLLPLPIDVLDTPATSPNPQHSDCSSETQHSSHFGFYCTTTSQLDHNTKSHPILTSPHLIVYSHHQTEFYSRTPHPIKYSNTTSNPPLAPPHPIQHSQHHILYYPILSSPPNPRAKSAFMTRPRHRHPFQIRLFPF